MGNEPGKNPTLGVLSSAGERSVISAAEFRARAQKAPRRRAESALLRTILTYLSFRSAVVFGVRVQSGEIHGFRAVKPAAYSGAKGKRGAGDERLIPLNLLLAPRGTPDVLGAIEGGRLLAVETKSPDGRLSEEQRATLARLARLGAYACVPRTFDWFRAWLDRAIADDRGYYAAGAKRPPGRLDVEPRAPYL